MATTTTSEGGEGGVPAVVPTRGADSRRAWAQALVDRARSEGVALTGEDDLLTSMVREVLQAGLDVEMADHLGYEPYDAAGRNSGNSRNGSYQKTVKTDVGPVELQMPRDREGTFDPVTVPKHVRRLEGLGANVLSLYAKGLTTGEIQAHLAEI
jgi:putative transposase